MIKRLLVLPILFAVIGFSFYTKITAQFSTPEATIRLFGEALRRADLPLIAECGLRSNLDDSILTHGTHKHVELMTIFEEVKKKGRDDYAAFLKKVQDLGLREFRRMSKEERTLMEATIGKKKFILDAGIKQLSPEDRNKIADIENFLKGEEEEQFCIREGLDEISHEKWGRIKDYDYSVLKHQSVRFIREEGKKLIREELQRSYKDIEATIENLNYIDDFPGSLFKGSKISLELRLQDTQKGEQLGFATVTLRKYRGKWLIESIYPPLF